MIALLFGSALAAPVPFDGCSAGVAPAAYGNACHDVCIDHGSHFQCDVGAAGAVNPSLFAATNWSGKDGTTSIWGTTKADTDFCCEWDNSDPWVDWRFLGSTLEDDIHIGVGGQYNFCLPAAGVEVLIKTFGDDDTVEIVCDAGSPFLDTTVSLGAGHDEIDALGWATAATSKTYIWGESGNDIVLGASTTPNWMDGGTGIDLLTGGSDDDILRGGDGADVLTGNDGADVMCAGDADDDDVLDGRDSGSAKADVLYAYAGGYSSTSGISGFSDSADTCSVIYGGVSPIWAGSQCGYFSFPGEPLACL